MADLIHIKKILQGTQVWNRWAQDNDGFPLRIDLTGIDLHRKYLPSLYLCRADLCRANLEGAYLVKADLSDADLSNANLRNADLSYAILSGTNLSRSDITGAKLFGTARDKWKIEKIKCEFIFFDVDGLERTPKSRNFKISEFEELYSQLPTIEYYFKDGFTPIDTIVMDQVVEAINLKHSEFKLRLDSFHSRGKPYVKLTVIKTEYKEKALEEVTRDYEKRIKIIESQRDELRKAFNILANRPQIYAKTINNIIQSDKIENFDIRFGDTIDIKSEGDVAFSKDQGMVEINKTIRPK